MYRAWLESPDSNTSLDFGAWVRRQNKLQQHVQQLARARRLHVERLPASPMPRSLVGAPAHVASPRARQKAQNCSGAAAATCLAGPSPRRAHFDVGSTSLLTTAEAWLGVGRVPLPARVRRPAAPVPPGAVAVALASPRCAQPQVPTVVTSVACPRSCSLGLGDKGGGLDASAAAATEDARPDVCLAAAVSEEESWWSTFSPRAAEASGRRERLQKDEGEALVTALAQRRADSVAASAALERDLTLRHKRVVEERARLDKLIATQAAEAADVQRQMEEASRTARLRAAKASRGAY
jgi:hypothetical protein